MNYYNQGFSKVASDYGIPVETLLDFAQHIVKTAGLRDDLVRGIDAVSDAYNGLSTDTQRGILGALAGGTAGLTLSEGDFRERLAKALLTAGLAGFGTYGASHYRLGEKARKGGRKTLDYITD